MSPAPISTRKGSRSINSWSGNMGKAAWSSSARTTPRNMISAGKYLILWSIKDPCSMVSSKFSFRFYLGFIIAAAPLTFGLYGLTHPSQMIVIKHGVTENGSALCYVLVGVGLWSLAWQLFNASTLKVWSDRIGIKHLFYRTTVLKEDIITIDLFGRMKGSAFD